LTGCYCIRRRGHSRCAMNLRCLFGVVPSMKGMSSGRVSVVCRLLMFLRFEETGSNATQVWEHLTPVAWYCASSFNFQI
jgi:hypothetical protein